MTEYGVYYRNDRITLNDSKNQPNTNTFITKIIIFAQKFAGFLCHNKAVITQICYKSIQRKAELQLKEAFFCIFLAALFDDGLIVRHMWRIFVIQTFFYKSNYV
jgi:hypothetical protein